MIYGLKMVTPPVGEPITAAQAKLHCRVPITEEDTLVTRQIAAARGTAEMITRRRLIEQQWKLVLDDFPRPGLGYSPDFWISGSQQYGGTAPGPIARLLPEGVTGFEISVPYPPLQSVDAITYYDATGALQTLDPAQYLIDDVQEPARIVPAPGVTWPSTQRRINAVTVLFTCGYGEADDVESEAPGIIQWILLRVCSYYEHREEAELVPRGKLEDNPFVHGLLNEYRVLRFR